MVGKLAGRANKLISGLKSGLLFNTAQRREGSKIIFLHCHLYFQDTFHHYTHMIGVEHCFPIGISFTYGGIYLHNKTNPFPANVIIKRTRQA